MEWYEEEVRTLEVRVQDSPQKEKCVAFYGSSTIRLWSSLENEFADLPAMNLGFGGSTLEACAHFFERTIIPLRPRQLVIYAGDNDLGDGRAPADVHASFRRLVKLWTSALPETPLWFISIKPSPSRWSIFDRMVKANRLVRDEIERLDRATYIDLVPHMLGPTGLPRKELFSGDGLHLSPAGYKVWSECLRAVLQTASSAPDESITQH